MDIGRLFDFISEMLQRGIPVFAGAIVGFIVATAMFMPGWGWRRLKRPKGDPERATLTARYEKLEAEKRTAELEAEGKTARIDDLTAQLESQQDQLREDAEKIKALEQDNAELSVEFAQLNEQLNTLTKLDGDVWEKPPRGEQIPPFRTLIHGRPPIIAVVNLKGGVGKTTITANLAAAAMHLGQAPLLVDLDYQNSLSGLALEPQLRADLSSRRQVVSRLIDSPEPTGADVLGLMQRIGNGKGFVLASDERLASVEMQVMARWITNGTDDDVRYRLRRALHSDEVQSRFDVILIDCPPRITTACVNALAACDYVLIPALLDNLSLDAVPRLLAWLRIFKVDRQICPNMSVVGVVGNRAQNTKGMSDKQRRSWYRVETKCRDAWGDSVFLFETPIPDVVGFADAANHNAFAADTEKLRPVFLDLYNELMQRIPFHAGQGTPAVSR